MDDLRQWCSEQGDSLDGADLVIACGDHPWGDVLPEFTTAPLFRYAERTEEARRSLLARVGELYVKAATAKKWPKIVFLWGDADEETQAEAKEAWRDGAAYGYQRVGTISNLAEAWVEAMLEVLPSYVDRVPINVAEGALKGVPAFIVGAGPSLSENVDELRRLAGRGLVLTSTTAMGVLERAGVPVDLLLVNDTKDVSGLLRTCEHLDRTICVPANHPPKEVVDLDWRTVMPALVEEMQFGRWLRQAVGVRTRTFPVGGSVTCLAAALAQFLGCDPIVLVGQDCALAPDGRHHALGSLETGPQAGRRVEFLRGPDGGEIVGFRHTGAENWRPCVPTMSWDGESTVYAAFNLHGFRQWFEDWGEVWRDKQSTTTINATEGGAYIRGWTHEALADVMDRLPPLVEVERTAMTRLMGAELEARAAGKVISREELAQALDRQVQGAEAFGRVARRGIRLGRRYEKGDRTIDLERIRAQVGQVLPPLVDSYAWPRVQALEENAPLHAILATMEERSAHLLGPMKAAREAIRE